MSIVTRFHSIGSLAIIMASALLGGQAYAFDPQAARQQQGTCCDAAALTALREATRAYYSGDKREALTGLLAAAQSGHPGAQWKLGNMYARGDGVDEDDIKAFGFFNELVNAHGDDAPTSPEAPFVASAFVEIGSYYLTGINNSAVQPNVRRAREIFTYAASYFGNAEAQAKLGDMYLDGVGGDRDARQAARWFLLAARKGQIGAQYKLGEMLVKGDQIEANPVVGLMWLTIALKRADQQHMEAAAIRAAHEEAFSLSGEQERRKALAMAQKWLADNDPAYMQALNAGEPAVSASTSAE
jgi:TPR repeat protein